MLSLVKVFVVAAVVAAVAAQWQAPGYCHGLDCPIFKELYNDPSANITYRQYQGAVWVRTNVTGISYKDALNEGFNKLFDYISGANDQGIKVDMTTPVNTQVLSGAGPFCASTFIVSFYAPYIYQQAGNPPPTPTDPTVYVQFVEETTKAVYGFGGYADKWQPWVDPSVYLYSYLEDQSPPVPLVTEYEWTNQYDSPFKPVHRHNEVWIDIEYS